MRGGSRGRTCKHWVAAPLRRLSMTPCEAREDEEDQQQEGKAGK